MRDFKGLGSIIRFIAKGLRAYGRSDSDSTGHIKELVKVIKRAGPQGKAR
jgi:hypothetical protein